MNERTGVGVMTKSDRNDQKPSVPQLRMNPRVHAVKRLDGPVLNCRHAGFVVL